MGLITGFRNLSAVPSVHYHPIFGREVIRRMRNAKPAAIALELPEMWAAEFEWGVSLWPSPVVSYGSQAFLPIVPGDSMVEAYRLAKISAIPVFFVDFAPIGCIRRPSWGQLPDPAFASRVGIRFLEASDALQAAAGPPAQGDVAREAYMAARLAELMDRFDTVLWVGGMAHWSRIRNRLKAGDFTGPKLHERRHPKTFRRMRLESTALHKMTKRLPFQLTGFSSSPEAYDEATCTRELALATVKPEKHAPIDVASMLVYARNLQAMEHLSESPGLWNLLTAASTCLGNEYASRLATLALADQFTREAEDLPLLTHGVKRGETGKHVGVYRSNGRALVGESLFGSFAGNGVYVYRKLPTPAEIKRRARNTPATEVKSSSVGERQAWVFYPADEIAYEAFVRYVLEYLGGSEQTEMTSVRFVGSMGEGVDLRETIRYLHEGSIHVKEPLRPPVRIRNGLIDFTSDTEDSWILQKGGIEGKCGWIDPDLEKVGSVSRTTGKYELVQKQPFWVQRDFRELSLITLDAPTIIRPDDRLSFYSKVISPLLDLPHSEDNLYGWLRVMFEFCRNKPFAYYSRYKPGTRVHALAREFGVRVIHLPLGRIPRRTLERHRSFQFLHLTRKQWHDLLERISEMKSAWRPGKAPE
jgi:hypothetical protein